MLDPKPAWPPVTADGAFATTQWTVIMDAASDGNAESSRALAKLCETYWPPVYAFIRFRGNPPEEAKDLTQGFFAHLLEKRHFDGADRTKGKFRTYLLGAVKFFLSDEHKRSQAQKRGGGAVHLSIDAEEAEQVMAMASALVESTTPEHLFDQQWIRTVIARVMEDLREESESRGKGTLFDELKGFLIGTGPQRTYAEIAESHGVTESAVKMNVKRLRSRFGDLLRERVSETVDNESSVDEEIRALMAVYL